MVIVIGRLRGHNRSCRHRCRRPLGARAHPGRRRAPWRSVDSRRRVRQPRGLAEPLEWIA